MQNRIELEQIYPHSIGRVWSAITDAREIAQWFIQADFEAKVGYPYTFTHESTRVTGVVLVVDPPHRLSYTWIVSGTTARTVVNWVLREVDGGTLLHLEHSGFEKYGDTALSMFESSVEGWKAVASELEKYLEAKIDGD